MQSNKLRLGVLAMLPFVLGASACDKRVRIQAALPPAADLVVEPKPVPTIDILTDATAEANYNSDVEAWGERGWDAVARICRWAKAHGGPVVCPKPD